MRTFLDCYPCFLRQGLDAARYAGADQNLQEKIMQKSLLLLAEAQPGSRPPEISARIHRIVRAETGQLDAYKKLKQSSTQEALDLVPWLQQVIRESSDPLATALRLSAAGNIIDFGAAREFDLQAVIQQVLTAEFGVYDLIEIKRDLEKADTILFLADNAGETVFDRLLIEQIGKAVHYAVKSIPILNDAILEDALSAGLDRVASILETGLDLPGSDPQNSTPEFKQLFQTADLIISKGQGNYEMLSEHAQPIYFLLKAKCAVIARDLQVPLGSFILKKGGQ
jgi:damage-control phosphatase, subfamily I